MRRPSTLLLLTLLAWSGVAAAAEAAEPPCSEAMSTLESSRCLTRALAAADERLEQALADVAREAAEVPSDVFQTLWRDNLTEFHRTSAEPKEQAEAFRSERRKVCAYAKSIAFQGTGYGIFVSSCELDLTETLLKQFEP